MEIHVLHLEHVWLLALYTLLAVTNSLTYKGLRGIHWFSLYNLFALLGAIAVALRGHIPDGLSILGGNLFVVAGYFSLFLSLAALFGRRASQIYWQLGCIVVAVVTMVQYGLIHPDTQARLIAYSIVLCCQQAHIAIFICRKKDGTLRPIGTPMALVMAALACTNLVRLFGTTSWGAPSNYLRAGHFFQSILIANSCLQCGAMVAYVWMTAGLLRTELETQASTDPLTKLLNRRAMELAAERELAFCSKVLTPLCAIVIDLDDFKTVNDSYGHHCGDATLIAVAGCLKKGLRKTDHLARLGGDEFAILLPGSPIEEAAETAERLRSCVAELVIVYGEVQTKVTASFGLASARGSATTWDDLLLMCDQALYTGKRSGGNLVRAGFDDIAGIALPDAISIEVRP
ncbi:GGDEF domain-containing protein [Terriglobus saanensis]|uniref:diguanylate cyclase n=1 Tax=Terriglobus saanensis (strain ATCC BAA-1853 / DSM 23119 / SP1PR4) TaxID=401053 RepID=E8UZ72_TERSS|nr:GGDEF domain-containing protein [Terriglobus saanensis]ADV82090.1 diguanylate cyclase [Terriglobus saanensis SP1PR4]